MNMTITAERDARNKMLINHSFRRAIGLGLTAEQIRLIDYGTPEERASYVKKQRKHFFIGAAVVGGYFIISPMIPRDPVPPPPAPEISTAGQIQSLQLHETAFSTSTTVVTETGTYQVHGGVSASAGDTVSLKRETHPIQQTSLCVESKIKAQCYRLL